MVNLDVYYEIKFVLTFFFYYLVVLREQLAIKVDLKEERVEVCIKNFSTSIKSPFHGYSSSLYSSTYPN